MQDRIEQNALELLHAIREHHPDIYAGAWVNPYTAALEAGLQTSPLSARHIAGVTLAEIPGVECARGPYLWDFTLFTSSISRHPKSAYASQGLCRGLGLDPDSTHYRAAMEYLQAEDVLEEAEETRQLGGGGPLYTITLRGMEMLREV
jgi:hypothetical protein